MTNQGATNQGRTTKYHLFTTNMAGLWQSESLPTALRYTEVHRKTALALSKTRLPALAASYYGLLEGLKIRVSPVQLRPYPIWQNCRRFTKLVAGLSCGHQGFPSYSQTDDQQAFSLCMYV